MCGMAQEYLAEITVLIHFFCVCVFLVLLVFKICACSLIYNLKQKVKIKKKKQHDRWMVKVVKAWLWPSFHLSNRHWRDWCNELVIAPSDLPLIELHALVCFVLNWRMAPPPSTVFLLFNQQKTENQTMFSWQYLGTAGKHPENTSELLFGPALRNIH